MAGSRAPRECRGPRHGGRLPASCAAIGDRGVRCVLRCVLGHVKGRGNCTGTAVESPWSFCATAAPWQGSDHAIHVGWGALRRGLCARGLVGVGASAPTPTANGTARQPRGSPPVHHPSGARPSIPRERPPSLVPRGVCPRRCVPWCARQGGQMQNCSPPACLSRAFPAPRLLPAHFLWGTSLRRHTLPFSCASYICRAVDVGLDCVGVVLPCGVSCASAKGGCARRGAAQGFARSIAQL